MPTATLVEPLSYDELTDAAKAKAREILRFDSRDELEQTFSEWIWENLEHGLQDDDFMSYWGFPGFKVHYDLSFCQGSGIGFEGTIDATYVTADDWAPILVMLGANRERHVLRSGLEVSWPRPITRMTVEIENHNPWFNEHKMDLVVAYGTPAVDEDGDPLDDEDYLRDDHPIFKAVSLYFSQLSSELYRIYSDELLNADEDLDRVASFFDWQDHVRFNQWGDRIDELDDDDIQELEEEHA